MKEQTITIKGQPYKLILKNGCFLSGGHACLGLTDEVNKEITIDINDTDYLSTLLHELMHAYFWECGLSDYSDDETLVEWLALQLPQISDTYNQCKNLINKQKKKK